MKRVGEIEREMNGESGRDEREMNEESGRDRKRDEWKEWER